MKKMISSISFLLFNSLQEDLRNNPPATKQFIAHICLLVVITAVAWLYFGLWKLRPNGFVVIGCAALVVQFFIHRHYNK